MSRSGRALLLVTALSVALPPPAYSASFPPWFHFRTLVTEKVTVHFHQGLEPMARQAAPLAGEILRAHEARYGVRLRRVHIVISDQDDDPNGFTYVLPYPLVQIRVAAPDGTDEFGNYEGWLRLVLTHELAHVVHLEGARALPGFGRKVLGRAPYLFPNTLAPAWMVEGLATYEETEGTAFGRGRNPDSRMVVRMATLDRGIPHEDTPATFPDRWPGGFAPYLFGEAFVRDLSVRFGSDVLPRLARSHSGNLVPFVDDLTAHRVTGGTFHVRWREWSAASLVSFEDEAMGIRARGVTSARALTRRGIVQVGPRVSPDGAWVAYTSRILTRYRAIRLVRPDGSGDRWLANRNGGDTLAWTPDARTIVFDEPDVQRLFTSYSDLRAVDVASGRVRRLTRGLRAREPDISPDGRLLAFVRRIGDRSEVWVMGLDGKELRELTQSAPGTQWSGPRWSPGGGTLVAARWSAGGWVDLLLIDAATGALTPLTEDRARDVEPTWTPDGGHLVFRSDRDGVSNLYALRLADRALQRVTNVLGGAFFPSVSPDGRSVAFSEYGAGGYDVRVADLDLGRLAPADVFVDRYGAPRPLPEPTAVEARPYRPLPAMLPRFWSPYAASISGEWQWGATTGGADPLFRHAWGLLGYYGATTQRASGQAFYQYDRFRPTLLLTAQDKSEPEETEQGEAVTRTQELGLKVTFPIARSFRRAQSLSLAWRFKRESLLGAPQLTLDLGGLEAAWAMSSLRQYPYSISPAEGWRLRFGVLKEDPAFGSDVSLTKLTADLKASARVVGEGDVLALRLGGGTTLGRSRFKRSFAVGGFPDGALFDVVLTNFSVLRGYPDDAFSGRSFAHANLEYRVPLAHPQRGYHLLPFFVRHLHATAFLDAANAWSGGFRLEDLKTGAGAALGSDLVLGHGLPLTVTAGLAHGFAEKGETRAYFRLGLAF